MNKLEFVQSYIDKCEVVIVSGDISSAKKLLDIIIGVYANEIMNITAQLDYPNPYQPVDFIGNVNKLKEKLILHKVNLQHNDIVRADEIEKLRLQQSIVSITNTNQNAATSNASANASAISTVDQVIECIMQLPDEVLPQADKESLEDKLAALDLATKSNNKAKIIDKIGGVLKFITEKGIQVGIAVLPYLGDISKMIQK